MAHRYKPGGGSSLVHTLFEKLFDDLSNENNQTHAFLHTGVVSRVHKLKYSIFAIFHGITWIDDEI